MLTIIKLARLKTGMSLRRFARIYGFPEAKLCQIERGRVYIPPSWRGKLAKVFGLTVEEICDENGWPRLYEDSSVAIKGIGTNDVIK
jgi:transcriptional regulator with XRE-family HTH domain